MAPRQEATPSPREFDYLAIVGSTNAHLIIDRLSAGAEILLGFSSRDLIGQSLLELVSPTEVLSLVRAAARSIETDDWTRLSVSVPRKEEVIRCSLVLVPAHPAPSLMFAVSNDSAGSRWLGRGDSESSRKYMAQSPGSAHEAALRADILGLTQLSAREVEVVRHLVNGDRVPAIARGLFISQSTVRNHLSTVFRKMGVRSQQELIHVLREAGPEIDAWRAGNGGAMLTDR